MKRLTDAELAAEYHAALTQPTAAVVGDDGRVRRHTPPALVDVFRRFATHDHYDQEAAA